MKASPRFLVIATLLAIAFFALPAAADAAFPGQNGKIAFVRAGDIWTMKPDGTNQVNLTNSVANEYTPSWSADGNEIAFTRGSEVWTMFADGTGQQQIPSALAGFFKDSPAWSPAGDKIAFAIDGRCDTVNPQPGFENGGVWTMSIDGTGLTHIGCTSDNDDNRGYTNTNWSPDGNKIVFHSNLGFQDIYTVPPSQTNGFPTQGTNLTNDTNFDENPDWSPDNQKIAWDSDRISGVTHIWTMNPDGSGKTRLTSSSAVEQDPAWSPDGSKIAYFHFQSPAGIHVVSTDGTGDTFLADGSSPSWQPLPTAGPSADLIASIEDAPDPIPAGGYLHYTASAKNLVGPNDSTGVVLKVNLSSLVFFVSATPTQGSCGIASQVVTCQFGNLAKGSSATVDIKVEPRGPATISASASVSGNETDPIAGNNSQTTTTTVTDGGQPRPKGATPLRVSLVPAYKPCTTDEQNEQHGAPLSSNSCAPPVQTSSYLTVGTLDANGQGANFIGSVRFDLIQEDPTNPNNGDQSDVGLKMSLTDVRNKSDLSDYTGELAETSNLRITDHDNGAGDFTAATVTDMPLGFTIPCAATVFATTGALCTLNSTVEAFIPGAVKESMRSIWELDHVRVFDGGADGSADTTPNTLFATEGLFVP